MDFLKKMITYIVIFLLFLLTIGFLSHQMIGFERIWAAFTDDDLSGWTGFETLHKEKKKNQYLVCPQNLCARVPDRPSPDFPTSAEQLTQIVLQIMEQEGQAKLIKYDAATQTYIFQTHSPTLRFPDLTFLKITDLNDGAQAPRAQILIFAMAQLGELDFGANQKRIDLMLDLVASRFN